MARSVENRNLVDVGECWWMLVDVCGCWWFPVKTHAESQWGSWSRWMEWDQPPVAGTVGRWTTWASKNHVHPETSISRPSLSSARNPRPVVFCLLLHQQMQPRNANFKKNTVYIKLNIIIRFWKRGHVNINYHMVGKPIRKSLAPPCKQKTHRIQYTCIYIYKYIHTKTYLIWIYDNV